MISFCRKSIREQKKKIVNEVSSKSQSVNKRLDKNVEYVPDKRLAHATGSKQH